MTSTMIYITTSSRDEALRIGRAVVADRLAACANVLPGVTSVFWWREEVQEGAETSLILKTRGDLVERLTARVKELHSYECPCVVALPIADGNPDFLRWITEVTR
jgi:periplasmic divalent cation tolerance protein